MKFNLLLLGLAAGLEALPISARREGSPLPSTGAILLRAPSGKDFLYVAKAGTMNTSEAISVCRDLGAKLADLRINDDYTYLSQQIDGAAWISSFDGKSMGPFALFAGGAIRALRDPHEDLKGAICQL